MKCALLIILSCLILAGSSSAIQEPVSAPLNQDIPVAASAAARPALLVVPCSDDPFPIGTYGVIWMKNWTNGGWSNCHECSLKIDGAAPHNWGWTFGFFSSSESQYKFLEVPGTHSYQVTTSTGTETGTIRVCVDKITYIYSNKPSPAVTTPTTAAVTAR